MLPSQLPHSCGPKTRTPVSLRRAQKPRQFPCFFSSGGSARTHSTAWGWQAMPMFEHEILPASRWHMTQRSVHTAQPGRCAWTAGSFDGTVAGGSGTTSADGSACSVAQFTHDGASAALAAMIVATAATMANGGANQHLGDAHRPLPFVMAGLV